MENHRKQKLYRTMTRSVAGVSLATAWVLGLGCPCDAQSVKKTTSDPYYSSLRQSEAKPAELPAQPSPLRIATPMQIATPDTGSSFYKSNWNPPKTPVVATPAMEAKRLKSESAAQVWSSVSRQTTQPVTRIDFSKLDVKPKTKADASLPAGNLAAALEPLKPANFANSQTKANGQFKPQSLTPIKSAANVAAKAKQNVINGLSGLKNSATQKSSIIRQKASSTLAAATGKTTTALTASPKANTFPPAAATPLTPWKKPADFNMPKLSQRANQTGQIAQAGIAQASVVQAGGEENLEKTDNTAARIAAVADANSSVKPAAFQPQLGTNLKKVGSKIKSIASDASAAKQRQGVRVADATNNFYHPSSAANLATSGSGTVNSGSGSGTVNSGSGTVNSGSGTVNSGSGTVNHSATNQAYATEAYGETVPEYEQGESFESSRVLALVGGHPVFVGDIMFEVNQVLEKYMKDAPQSAKDAQKGKLTERLLQKYIDQKILYVSTLNQLPEGADINDILKQAEKTFNDKALPDVMANSGVDSVSQFDGILRSQGSSVRQMRRSWAKDQISKFFLQEKVKFNRQVTHLQMLDEYRANYDDYAVKGKVRFEQIEIQPTKAGGRFAAKDKIDDIYNRVVHGANFAAIAKKESHGFRAFNGGQYDWTSKGSLVNKEIDKQIFSLPQGQLSGVIESKTGFHIIRIIERVEDHRTPFTEAQVEIKKQLLEARRDVAFRTYIDNLKEEITVEYVTE